MTIHSSGMQSAINSGAIELHKEPLNDIANYTLSMFNRFLQSNAELRLEDSFKIYFKVLSLEHVNYQNHRRGPLAVLGCKNNKFIPGTLEFSNGFCDQPNVFENMCLLTSVILGKEKINATKTKHFLKFNLLLALCDGFTKPSYANNSKKRRGKKDPITELRRKKAGLFMLKEINFLIKKYNLPETGPYNAFEVCPLLSEYFKCQIHIIEGMQTKDAAILSFPSQFTDSLPQIVLFKIDNDHVTFISNLKMFFRHFNKRICFGCFKTFSPRYRHVCKKTICFACRRPFASEYTDYSSDPFFDYCDSQLEALKVINSTNSETDSTSTIKSKFLPIPIKCTICNGVSNTKYCEEGHEKICGKKKNNPKGRAGYHCPDCGKFQFSAFSNAEEARLKHDCCPGTKNCKICGVIIKGNHQCLIKKETHSSKWPCLAFFSFSYKYLAQCKNCYEIKQEFAQKENLSYKDLILHEQFEALVCDKHLSNFDHDPQPNLAVLYREVQRGIFKQYVITEDTLNISSIDDENLESIYFPENFTGAKPYVSYQTYKHAANSLEISRVNIEKNEKKTMIQNFLLLITSPDWQNTTFLSHNANNAANLSILKGLLEFNLIPSVIQDGNKVNLISLDFLEIRFLNASSFIAGTMEEWSEMFKLNEKLHYFPEK